MHRAALFRGVRDRFAAVRIAAGDIPRKNSWAASCRTATARPTMSGVGGTLARNSSTLNRTSASSGTGTTFTPLSIEFTSRARMAVPNLVETLRAESVDGHEEEELRVVEVDGQGESPAFVLETNDDIAAVFREFGLEAHLDENFSVTADDQAGHCETLPKGWTWPVQRPSSAYPPSMGLTSAALQTQVKRHLGDLAAVVDATARDEGFNEALRNMARFWRYSFLNQTYIRIQRKDATRVAGRLAWEAIGRKVRPGQEPMVILAPSRYRGGLARFVPVDVYDVKQTRGRKVKELDLLLTGRTRHWRTLERAAKALGIEVAYVPFGAPATGRSLGGRIEIKPGLPSMERTATLAHELAHELLHQVEHRRQATMKRPGRRLTRAEMETEADATTYVVMSVLGLPSKAPSYIPWQGGSGNTVLRAMTRVQGAVRAIVEAVEPA